MGWLMEISLSKLGELWLTIHITLFVSHSQKSDSKRKKLILPIGECLSRRPSTRPMITIWPTNWLSFTRSRLLFRLSRLTIQKEVGQKLSKPISDKLLQLTILAFTRATILILRQRKLVRKRPCPWRISTPIRLNIWPRLLGRTASALSSSIFPA